MGKGSGSAARIEISVWLGNDFSLAAGRLLAFSIGMDSGGRHKFEAWRLILVQLSSLGRGHLIFASRYVRLCIFPSLSLHLFLQAAAIELPLVPTSTTQTDSPSVLVSFDPLVHSPPSPVRSLTPLLHTTLPPVPISNKPVLARTVPIVCILMSKSRKMRLSVRVSQSKVGVRSKQGDVRKNMRGNVKSLMRREGVKRG